MGKGVLERRHPAGERQTEEGSEVGELQGERKDTRDEEKARTRAEGGGRERVKEASDRVLPPLPCTVRSREAKPKKKKKIPNLDKNQEVAHVGNPDCGISLAFPVAHTSLPAHIYVLCYIIYNKDACVVAVHTGYPPTSRFVHPSVS